MSMASGSEDRCFHQSIGRILVLLRIRLCRKVERLRTQRCAVQSTLHSFPRIVFLPRIFEIWQAFVIDYWKQSHSFHQFFFWYFWYSWPKYASFRIHVGHKPELATFAVHCGRRSHSHVVHTARHAPPPNGAGSIAKVECWSTLAISIAVVMPQSLAGSHYCKHHWQASASTVTDSCDKDLAFQRCQDDLVRSCLLPHLAQVELNRWL